MDLNYSLGFFNQYCKMTGYEPKSSFWYDLSIMEVWWDGNGIIEFCEETFENCKGNVTLLTEIVMCLNWKIWQYENDEERADFYMKLWTKYDSWCLDNLKDDELTYFIRTLD